jgi:hypothetical protein
MFSKLKVSIISPTNREFVIPTKDSTFQVLLSPVGENGKVIPGKSKLFKISMSPLEEGDVIITRKPTLNILMEKEPSKSPKKKEPPKSPKKKEPPKKNKRAPKIEIEYFTPNKDQKPKTLAKELHKYGVSVIAKTWLKGKISEYDGKWDDMLEEMPEYKIIPEKFVRGAFQALGNPSSFHNILVRNARQWSMHDVAPVLREYKDLDERWKDYSLEQYVDRLMYRPPGVKPSSESWHRDESPTVLKEDLTFGGWINFNDTDQHFSCVIGSHFVGQREGLKGFVKLTEEEKKGYSISPDRRIIVVPPGAIIIFNENIVHEVLPVVKNFYVKRLFLGWGLTSRSKPFIKMVHRPGTKEDLPFSDYFKLQRPITLKSGQYPDMYSSSLWRFTTNRNKTSDWSTETFVDECVVERIVNKGKETEEKVMAVHQFMLGLEEYGLPKYPRYYKDEMSMYRPGKRWRLLVPGKEDEKYVLEF